jgi:hypothetical protein
MDRGAAAANEMVNECYPVSDRRTREAFVARKDHRILVLQQAKLLEHPLILVGDLGSFPSRDLSFVHRGIGAWSRVPHQLRARRHGGALWWSSGVKESKSAKSSKLAMVE